MSSAGKRSNLRPHRGSSGQAAEQLRADMPAAATVWRCSNPQQQLPTASAEPSTPSRTRRPPQDTPRDPATSASHRRLPAPRFLIVPTPRHATVLSMTRHRARPSPVRPASPVDEKPDEPSAEATAKHTPSPNTKQSTERTVAQKTGALSAADSVSAVGGWLSTLFGETVSEQQRRAKRRHTRHRVSPTRHRRIVAACA